MAKVLAARDARVGLIYSHVTFPVQAIIRENMGEQVVHLWYVICLSTNMCAAIVTNFE